mgnify:CR=1 FL=1
MQENGQCCQCATGRIPARALTWAGSAYSSCSAAASSAPAPPYIERLCQRSDACACVERRLVTRLDVGRGHVTDALLSVSLAAEDPVWFRLVKDFELLALDDRHLFVVLELTGLLVDGGDIVVQGDGGADRGDGGEVRGGDESDLRRGRARFGEFDLDLVPAAMYKGEQLRVLSEK